MNTLDASYIYYNEPLSNTAQTASDPDYRISVKLLIICFLAAFISALLYFITKNRIIAAVPAGLAFLFCSLLHTPLAFVFLYSSLPFEMLIRPSEIFSISKLMGVIVLLSYLLMRLGRPVVFPSVIKWMIAFAVLTFSSFAWSIIPKYTFVASITIILHVSLIFLLINTIKSLEMFRLILWGFVISSAMGAALLFMGVGVVFDTGAAERIAFEGMNPNILAAQLAVSILCGLYLFFTTNYIGKVVTFSLCLMNGLGLLYSQSRSSLFGIFLAVGASFILMMKGRNKFVYIAAFLILCFGGYFGFKALLSSEILGRKAVRRLRTTQFSLEKSGRLHFWKQGVKFFSERPLNGYGYRNYALRYGGKLTYGRDAHNTYISVAVELGIIGLIIMGVIFLLLFKDSLKIPLKSVRWFCLSLFLFTAANGMTHTTYNQKDFWYALGFIALLTTLSDQWRSHFSSANEQELHDPIYYEEAGYSENSDY